MKFRFFVCCIGAALAVLPTAAQNVLFNFDNASIGSPLPMSQTSDGLTAQFSATGQGFSIQSANALGFTPAGFSGNCLYPSSVFASDLNISFSQSLSALSILYAPEEYACDSSATLRVTAFMDNTEVGTATMVADPPGTWPSATLAISPGFIFNNVVIHYDSAPPTGGDYGPIFMADNLSVTTAAVPEPMSIGIMLVGLGVILLQRKRGQGSRPSRSFPLRDLPA